MEVYPALLFYGFANYRIARMLTLEEGAFSIFARLRSKLGGDKQETWVGRGVSCPLCIGFWTALLIQIFAFGYFNFWQWIAIAGLQTFLQEMER